MSYLQKISDLYQRMEKGQMMEVFEEYYHPNVEVHEASGEVRKGKDAQREALCKWASSIKEVHGSGLGAITANEDKGVTSAESWMDVSFQDGNRIKMEEVAVQQWKDGQIIHERFYYNMAPPQDS